MNNATVERFSGFADTYDRYRPEPPEVLGEVLSQLAGVKMPELVIDLGCGTGLSTRYWAERAERVIGVDPSEDMLRQARAQTQAANVSYQTGFGHQTGLPGRQADILTCSQSLHWMEPEPTLAEIARLLRPGGVFAAYDHDHYPVLPHWEADQAYRAFQQRASALDDRYRASAGVPRWSKNEHLARIQASGHFRYAREFDLHQATPGDAERLVGLALSYGSVQSLLKAGASESELGLDVLREVAQRILGDQPQLWYWSTRVRVGIL
jgi:ubiquinone/menaquinone biosynthesis C-methylase UbiE